MDAFDLTSNAFLTIALVGFGTLMLRRLSRIEDKLKKLCDTAATIVTRGEVRGEFAKVRGELAGIGSELAGVKGELAALTGEFAQHRREMREDLAYLRSDLTAVALMFAPERPKASEGCPVARRV